MGECIVSKANPKRKGYPPNASNILRPFHLGFLILRRLPHISFPFSFFAFLIISLRRRATGKKRWKEGKDELEGEGESWRLLKRGNRNGEEKKTDGGNAQKYTP